MRASRPFHKSPQLPMGPGLRARSSLSQVRSSWPLSLHRFEVEGFPRSNSSLTNPNPGANSPLGIGRATAHQFAQSGAKAVYICDFDDKYLGYHERQIKSLYPGCTVHTRKFDAADEPAVKAVVDDALERYGRLDVFFANAGIIGQPTLFTNVSKEDFMEVLRVNTLGCVVPSPPPLLPAPFPTQGPGGCTIK